MFDLIKTIMQLTGNTITILGLILFIIIWSKKVKKDVKAKRELKKIEKDNKLKEEKIKSELYAVYLKNEKLKEKK